MDSRLPLNRANSRSGKGYILGVDGGNTKTIALVGTLDGTVVGVGRGGCSDIYYAASSEVALDEVEAAISAALAMARISPGDLEVGAFSMAGADWPDDFEFLQAELGARGFGRRIKVVNDGVGALRASTLDGFGVVVACGTGTATAARSQDGRVWHSSWWQEPQGAHELGQKTLWAVYRAEIGVDPPTSLREPVLRHFEAETVEEVLYLFTRRLGPRPPSRTVSVLSRVLLDHAAAGDEVALRIAREHGAALGDFALAAARQVGIEQTPFTLALTGGVMRHPSRLLPDALVARVRQTSPGVQPVFSRFEPAVGAFFLALEEAGVTIDESLVARLVPSLPAADLFAT